MPMDTVGYTERLENLKSIVWEFVKELSNTNHTRYPLVVYEDKVKDFLENLEMLKTEKMYHVMLVVEGDGYYILGIKDLFRITEKSVVKKSKIKKAVQKVEKVLGEKLPVIEESCISRIDINLYIRLNANCSSSEVLVGTFYTLFAFL